KPSSVLPCLDVHPSVRLCNVCFGYVACIATITNVPLCLFLLSPGYIFTSV
ncbi:uncharacterized protein M437DRAFT_37709, partial [Aureobasidium melanogenum CBS 110374]